MNILRASYISIGLSNIHITFMFLTFITSEIFMLKKIVCEKCVFPNSQHVSMATLIENIIR